MALLGAIAGVVAAAIVLVPLAAKWGLPFGPVAAWTLGAGAAWGALWAVVLGHGAPASWSWAALHAATVLASSALVTALAFFRDPDRVVPDAPGVIVSPADGRVLYVRTVARGEVPPVQKRGRPLGLRELAAIDICESGHLIGIGMHLLDVHVNRAPIAGRVTTLKHVPGSFLSLKVDGATAANERLTTVIDDDEMRVGVVQIASRLVRRIVSYVQQGDHVVVGQRIGMIRFGSQVDVIVPAFPRTRIVVRPGDAVRAGSSVLATSPAGEVGWSAAEQTAAGCVPDGADPVRIGVGLGR